MNNLAGSTALKHLLCYAATGARCNWFIHVVSRQWRILDPPLVSLRTTENTLVTVIKSVLLNKTTRKQTDKDTYKQHINSHITTTN